MKKILLSSVILTSMLSPVTAESFSGVFGAIKGSVLFMNKGTLPDLTKGALTVDNLKDYGSFGFNGGALAGELGYSFRSSNNFVIGLSLGGGYKHHSIKEEKDTEVGTDKKQLGLDFITSSMMGEARLRLGMAFGRFHVYLNPGLELAMANPELTVTYKGEGDKNETHKITYATDKGPEWQERLSFVMGLNVEYAVTQTVFLGGGIGYRHSFADVKSVKDVFSDETKTKSSVVGDIAYKKPFGLEASIMAGVSF